LHVPVGPITRIQEIWGDFKMGHSKLGSKENEGVINLIQAIDGADLA
jgi:hypothetical protein